MQKFWYHSPVRFYRSLEELADRTNPQNNQFFGTENNPYPLEIGRYHRFLIPKVNNEVSGNLKMFVGDYPIPCDFGFDGSNLVRVTFISNEEISGRIEIKKNDTTIFWSNCVRFTDSDFDGRKFIRIITKHSYDRNLFSYKTPFDWIVTNLPAYDLGQFYVNSEINNIRIGGNGTLKTKEANIDEVVKYELLAHGDANIISFIQVHATNNEFYIDGTKRTLVEKIDADDFAMSGILKLANQKDGFGKNITINEDDVIDIGEGNYDPGSGSYNFIYFGAYAPDITDYSALNKTSEHTFTFVLNTGTTYKDFYILLPDYKKLSSVWDLDIDGSVLVFFNDENIIIEGVKYRKYTMSNAVPYSKNHRFEVKITTA